MPLRRPMDCKMAYLPTCRLQLQRLVLPHSLNALTVAAAAAATIKTAAVVDCKGREADNLHQQGSTYCACQWSLLYSMQGACLGCSVV